MDGRLGNQFFRYAFARHLHKHNPHETIIYNFDAILRQHRKDGDGQENSLRYFKTQGTDLQDGVNYSVIQYIVNKIFRRFYPYGKSFEVRDGYERRWLPVLKFFGLYYLNLGYSHFPQKKPWWIKNLIVNGSFECEKYFSDVKDELKMAFQPSAPLLEYNENLMNIIRHENSVAVSIRRGDFVKDKSVRDVYYVCGQHYYEKAVEEIKKRVSNPVFIIFSNDIEWAESNFHITGAKCFYESGNDPAWETMRLMSSCKHFVISNSTFHWWAQELSTQTGKVVIAPSRWYNNKFESALYQKNWILIEP